MAAILLSAGSNVAFWDEQTLSKNSTYQKCNPPGILNCGSHWNSVVFSGTSKWSVPTPFISYCIFLYRVI